LGYCIASLLAKTFYLEICVTLSKEITSWSRFYCFIGAGKLFSGFFYRFIGEKILANQIVSFYLIFFSQKLCIGIAVIDIFLSIAAHLW